MENRLDYTFGVPIFKKFDFKNNFFTLYEFSKTLPVSSIIINNEEFKLHFCYVNDSIMGKGYTVQFGVEFYHINDPNNEQYFKDGRYRTMPRPFGNNITSIWNDCSVSGKIFKKLLFDDTKLKKDSEKLLNDIWKHMKINLENFFTLNSMNVKVKKRNVLFKPPQYEPYLYEFKIIR